MCQKDKNQNKNQNNIPYTKQRPVKFQLRSVEGGKKKINVRVIGSSEALCWKDQVHFEYDKIRFRSREIARRCKRNLVFSSVLQATQSYDLCLCYQRCVVNKCQDESGYITDFWNILLFTLEIIFFSSFLLFINSGCRIFVAYHQVLARELS